MMIEVISKAQLGLTSKQLPMLLLAKLSDLGNLATSRRSE